MTGLDPAKTLRTVHPRMRSLNVVLTAWAAIAAMLLEVAFPAAAFALHEMPGACQCAANGGECQCAGCCGNTADKAESCCGRTDAKAKPSCCQRAENGGSDVSSPKGADREKTAARENVAPKAAECCSGKPASRPSPYGIEGQCGCGDRPDTLTGETPPRLVPACVSAIAPNASRSHRINRDLLGGSLRLEPESPPPQVGA